MYKTILVPLDGSPRSEIILPHVEQLAQLFNSKVIFLRVVEPIASIQSAAGSHPEIGMGLRDQKAAEAESYVKAWQGEFREKGIEARYRIEHGPVTPAIINAAERDKVDLIAMASHGRSGVERVFYGSVAAGVLQRVSRPLLLVRSRRL
jgi:nucleotide-binding universal stress UspA family protein